MTEPLKVQCLDIDKEPLKGLNGTILYSITYRLFSGFMLFILYLSIFTHYFRGLFYIFIFYISRAYFFGNEK